MATNDSRQRLATRVVGAIERRPWLALLAGLALFVTALAGTGRLVSDFTHRGFFHPTDPWLTAFERFEERFGNDDAVVLAVHSDSGIFDADSIGLLHELTEAMWQVPEVIRVDSITNFRWVHAEGDEIVIEPLVPDDVPITTELLAEREEVALRHESLPGYLISDDGRTTLLFGQIRPGGENEPDAQAITDAMRALVVDMERTDHEFHLAGAPTLVTAFAEVAASDNARVLPLVLIAIIVILAVALRSPVLILLSLMVVATSALGVLGIAGWLGIQITSITAALPQILAAIGVADSVHVLATFRRRRRQPGMAPRAAVRAALMKNVSPTLITTVTTAAGFLSFAASDIKPIAGLGLAAAVGTFGAWFYTYLILGGAMFLVPFKPWTKPQPRPSRVAARSAAFIGRYRRPILATFAIFFAGAVALAMRNRVDADPIKYFADGHPLRGAVEMIDEQVGSSRSVEVVIESGAADGAKEPAFLTQVDALEQWIEAQPEVTQVVSIVDTLKATNRSLNQGRQEAYALAGDSDTIAQELLLYSLNLPQGMDINNRITMDHAAVRLTVLWTIGSSTQALAAAERIEAKAASMGLDAWTTGKYQLYQHLEGYVVSSFLSSVGIALVSISLILMLLMRSFRLGLVALIPNAVPVLVGGGALWLMGESLNIGTVLVVSVALGIAVDDTVHILEEFRRRMANGAGSPLAAIEGVFEETAPVLLVTSAVLVVAFGIFCVATFTPYQVFGILTAIVLFAAVVTDVVLLPAMLMGRTAPETVSRPAVAAVEPTLHAPATTQAEG